MTDLKTVDEPDQKILKAKIQEIDRHHFQEKGARKEDALQGLKAVLERHFEGLLKRLISTFHQLLVHQLKQAEWPSSKEILAEFERKIHKDIATLENLLRKDSGKCLAHLPQLGVFMDFIEKHLDIRDPQIRKISEGIIHIMISENNALEIFNNLKGNTVRRNFSYLAFHDVLKLCVDKRFCPTLDDIKAMLTLESFTTGETLFAVLQWMELLIETYRKHGNSDPVEIFLNPVQNLYKVSKELMLAAGRVIKAAYCTLSNCLKSQSVINTLLFLGAGVNDGGDITISHFKECLEITAGLLQRDLTNSPVMEFLEEGENYKREQQEQKSEELRGKLFRRNDNCLRRSVFHLIAIFVHDEQILNHIPKEVIDDEKNGRDLHGCTPLHIAHLHGNQPVISLLESYQANVVADYFGRTPEAFAEPYEYSEDYYMEYCRKILTTKSSVFDTMKEMLVLPVKEYGALEEDFKALFEMMVAQDGFLNADIKIVGSVREKLKVGRFDEFDVQIRMKKKPFVGMSFESLRLHEYLVKRMAEIEWKQIPLRPVSAVSVKTPWKFVCERKGSFSGLVISVDTVPIIIEDKGVSIQNRQKLVISNDHGRRSLIHLIGNDLWKPTLWATTICMHEWDILDNMPAGCRLGILIAKALLQVLDQVTEAACDFMKTPITSYVIKNTLFWIIAGKTPKEIEKEHGNVMRERYGNLQQQLDFKETTPTWTTEEDLEIYGEEGKFWAETIFDAIHFMARNYQLISGSFLDDTPTHLSDHKVYDVLDTCERCLERLGKEVFFNEKLTD